MTRYLPFLLLLGCHGDTAPTTATSAPSATASITPTAATASSAAMATPAPSVTTNRVACERALSELARKTDAAHDLGGSTEVHPPAKTGDPWLAYYSRSHGSSDIALDPKTGAVSWGTSGSDMTPLEITAALRALVDDAKANCH